MKCNDCLGLIEQYVDGEVSEREAEQVRAHLITCASCTEELESLMSEQEMYALYDRELEIPSSVWATIAARIESDQPITNSVSRSQRRTPFLGLLSLPRLGFAFSSVMAVLIMAVVFGMVYLRSHRQFALPPAVAGVNNPTVAPQPTEVAAVNPPSSSESNSGPAATPALATRNAKLHQTPRRKAADDQGGVLFTDAAYSDIEERDTASHLEQAQDLLVSFRNIKLADDDEEVDVSYEKSESRRLLNDNIVLRRDAEMAGKFPAKSLLGSLEPFLIDIANLPDKASPADVRQIKDRVEKTEIVAELRSY